MSTNTGDAKVKLTLDVEEAKKKLGDMRQEVDRRMVADKQNPASPDHTGPDQKGENKRLTPQDVERIKGLNELAAHRRAVDKKDADWQARRSRIAEAAQRVSGDPSRTSAAMDPSALRKVADFVQSPVKSTSDLATKTLGPIAGELAAIGSTAAIGYGIARTLAGLAPNVTSFLTAGGTGAVSGAVQGVADFAAQGFNAFEAGISGIFSGISKTNQALKAQALATGEIGQGAMGTYFDMFSRYDQMTKDFESFIDMQVSKEYAGKLGQSWQDHIERSFKQVFAR